MNRTSLDKVRCMLVSSSFSNLFWAKATITATYLVNLAPSTSLGFKTPGMEKYHIIVGLEF